MTVELPTTSVDVGRVFAAIGSILSSLDRFGVDPDPGAVFSNSNPVGVPRAGRQRQRST